MLKFLKWTRFSWVLVFACSTLSGLQKEINPTISQCKPLCLPKSDFGTKLEGKVSYYLFSSSVLRKIYQTGAPNYCFSASQYLGDHFDLWTSVSYLRKSGYSLNGHQRTSVQIIPISLGFKYTLPLNLSFVDLYLNGAFKYFFFSTHDHSNFVAKHRSKSDLGGVVGCGSYFNLPRHFFLDLFIDYSFRQLEFSDVYPNIEGQRIQIGGWDFGAGIGYKF